MPRRRDWHGRDIAQGAAEGAGAGMAAGPWGALAGAIIGGGARGFQGARARQSQREAQEGLGRFRTSRIADIDRLAAQYGIGQINPELQAQNVTAATQAAGQATAGLAGQAQGQIERLGLGGSGLNQAAQMSVAQEQSNSKADAARRVVEAMSNRAEEQRAGLAQAKLDVGQQVDETEIEQRFQAAQDALAASGADAATINQLIAALASRYGQRGTGISGLGGINYGGNYSGGSSPNRLGDQ